MPATIVAAIFGFVGIKSTIDLASVEKQTSAMKQTATDLSAQYKPLQDALPELNQIMAQMRGLERRVKDVERITGMRMLSQRIFDYSKSTDPAARDELAAISKVLGVTKLDNPADWQVAIRQALFKAVQNDDDWAVLKDKLAAEHVQP